MAQQMQGNEQTSKSFLSAFDEVDTCEVSRYAIVSKNGKKGVYDLERHERVTAMDFDMLLFSHCIDSSDADSICYFYAEKEWECGEIGVVMQNNKCVSAWKDNRKYVVVLDDCTTLDGGLEKACRKVLATGMKRMEGNYGQIVVLDAKSGQLKAWVAMERNGKKCVPAKVFREACSVNCILPFMKEFVYGLENTDFRDASHADARQELERKVQKMQDNIACGDPLMSACIFQGICNGGHFLHPTLTGDEVVEERDIPIKKEVISDLRQKFTTKGLHSVSMTGAYAVVRNARRDRDGALVNELSYAGCFPSERPCYAIAAFVNISANIPTKQDLFRKMIEELMNIPK